MIDFSVGFPPPAPSTKQTHTVGPPAESLQPPGASPQKGESLVRDEKSDSNSFPYTYRPQGAFADLQPPAQPNPLRHRPSASNDALRAFGAVPNLMNDPPAKQSFPQELYSSSTSNLSDPSAFGRGFNGVDYELASSHSTSTTNTLNGSSTPGPHSILPRSNPFNMSAAASAGFSSTTVPLYSNQVQLSIAPGALQTSSLSQQTLPSATQPPPIPPIHNVSLSHSSVQQFLPGAPSTAQLMQALQSMPPQQKNAVVGRLQELAQSVPVPIPPASAAQQPIPGGQAQEEISTIFVVGFPDDMTEREFQNMFTFCPGYEAATLKVPTKEQQGQMAPNAAVAAAASALAGASDPYNLVTVNSGGVVVDQGNNTTATTSSTWATGLEDPYTRQVLAAAAASTTSASDLAQQLALAQQGQPRKQIIGFAKFRSREEALQARDVLHGRRVDIEKGALLKAEMAKKNLHTKRGVGPLQVQLPLGIGVNGPAGASGAFGVFSESAAPGTNGGKHLGPIVGPPGSLGPVQSLNESDRLSLGPIVPPLSNAPSPNDLTASSALSKAPDSPSLRAQRINDIPTFVPSGSGPVINNNGDQTLYSSRPYPVHKNANSSLLEGFHPLPTKPVSDIVKANALPPTNLPPPIITSLGAPHPPSSHGGSPPSALNQQDADTGYISDAYSTSRLSERSRSESVSRYGGYTPPLFDESHAHLPPHLLADDVLGTPQQTDYANKLFDSLPMELINGLNDALRVPFESGASGGPQAGESSANFPGSSASSVAESASSGGAESMSISTTSGQGSTPAPASTVPPTMPIEFGRPRQGTMGSKSNYGPNGGEHTRTSGEHPRGRSNAADQNPPINTLYVGNLPANPTNPQATKALEEALVQLFSRCQGYSKLSFRQKSNGPMCFVEFEDVASASKALSDLYGNNLNGLIKSGGIRLSYSKNPLGVRTAAPNTSGTNLNKLMSPMQSPTAHGNVHFSSMPGGMQDASVMGRGLGQSIEMPRRGRAETMEMGMGPVSPTRYLPASPPPNGSHYGMSNKPMGPYGRGPINIGGPNVQPFMMASSPPATSPISMYQPSSSFQPFSQLDLARDAAQGGFDPNL